MQLELVDLGTSRSVAEGDRLRDLNNAGSDAMLVIGGDCAARARAVAGIDLSTKRVVAVELGTECLEFHVGANAAIAARERIVGFARFRLGELAASNLVELVLLEQTSPEALAAAKGLFEGASLEVSVCNDVPGRIVDSLLRPYLNSALRSVDAGLAAPADLDQALRLGLGYPRGPLQLLAESGLAAHSRISSELYEALGDAGFVPARRARVSAMREAAGLE